MSKVLCCTINKDVTMMEGSSLAEVLSGKVKGRGKASVLVSTRFI